MEIPKSLLKSTMLASLIIAFTFLPESQVKAQCCGYNGQSTQGDITISSCGWGSFLAGSTTYTYANVDRHKTYRVERNGTAGAWTPYISVYYRNGGSWTCIAGPSTAVQWTASGNSGSNNHLIVVHRSSGCAGWISSSANLRYREVGTVGFWKGGENSNWIDSRNWECRAIPGAGTQTVIPGPCAGCNNPVISNDADVLCIKIDSDNGANLEVQGSSEILTVHGSVTGNCN